ncbi:hypothetical protein, partial [Streptomyces sp. UH6]|uniref:hypothetical protein n=1 Tax=Streptomyces sp. UH6 TaxID=2748379 RepID=UPI001C5545BB
RAQIITRTTRITLQGRQRLRTHVELHEASPGRVTARITTDPSRQFSSSSPPRQRSRNRGPQSSQTHHNSAWFQAIWVESKAVRV